MSHREPGDRGMIEWVRYLRDIGVRELHVPRVKSVSNLHAGSIGAPTVAGSARSAAPAARAPAPRPDPPPLFDVSPAPAVPNAEASEQLLRIREEIGDCTRCRLHEQRQNIVFGVGNPRAKLMFIGEGPGADEDRLGEPFVGRAGQKLDQMIAAIGLSREEVYIANIVKCRPPKNRDPRPDEVATCCGFLFAQIRAIRPSAIVTLGSPATRTLLNRKEGITRLRGTWHEFDGIPVMPTFHPAYLLRAYTVENRKNVFSDLKQAQARVAQAP